MISFSVEKLLKRMSKIFNKKKYLVMMNKIEESYMLKLMTQLKNVRLEN